MDEKRFAIVLFLAFLLVAAAGLILLLTALKTGAFGVRISQMQPGQPMMRVVKEDSSREIPVDVLKKTAQAAKIAYLETCCMWQDIGMLFYISPAAVEHMKFHPITVGTNDLFNKDDLEFAAKPDFYGYQSICVGGGTVENHQNSEKLCVKSYKGIEILPQAGLICISGRWWLAGNICPLSVPSEPAAVPQ